MLSRPFQHVKKWLLHQGLARILKLPIFFEQMCPSKMAKMAYDNINGPNGHFLTISNDNCPYKKTDRWVASYVPGYIP